MDAIVATEIRLKEPRDLIPFLNGYNKFISPGPEPGRMLVYKKETRV